MRGVELMHILKKGQMGVDGSGKEHARRTILPAGCLITPAAGLTTSSLKICDRALHIPSLSVDEA
jgi:hypothetical protein